MTKVTSTSETGGLTRQGTTLAVFERIALLPRLFSTTAWPINTWFWLVQGSIGHGPDRCIRAD